MPLTDGVGLVIPSLAYYEGELADMGLQARTPLLQHALAVGWTVQLAGVCALISVPATWWGSRGQPIPGKEVLRRLLGWPALIAFIAWLFYVFLTGPAFATRDTPRVMSNAAHYSDLHLAVQATIQPFLPALGLWFIFATLVDLIRHDKHQLIGEEHPPASLP